MICFYFKCLILFWLLRLAKPRFRCGSLQSVSLTLSSLFPLLSEQSVILWLLICCLHPVLSTSGVICSSQHGHPRAKQRTLISNYGLFYSQQIRTRPKASLYVPSLILYGYRELQEKWTLQTCSAGGEHNEQRECFYNWTEFILQWRISYITSCFHIPHEPSQ